jgi:hypothetical protein
MWLQIVKKNLTKTCKVNQTNVMLVSTKPNQTKTQHYKDGMSVGS